VAFKNVISNGLVLDKNCIKMSKRLGNVIDPFECIGTYGTDAVRWYMVTNSSPWDNLSFDPDGVKEVTSSFFIKLYQAYSFFTLYANVDGFEYKEADIEYSKRPDFDRWLLSELNTLVKDVDKYLADYDVTPSGRLIQNFVIDKLSNWYIRLNKKRFWGGGMTEDKLSAYQTLYTCIETVARLIAPISPFYADQLFKDLNEVTKRDESISVHLAKFPEANESYIDTELEQAMQVAMQVTSMVLSLRKKVKIPVIQALQTISIPASDALLRSRIERMSNVILAETNVKELSFIEEGSGMQLVKKVKCNFRVMGKKFGKLMKDVNNAVLAMSQEQIASLEANGSINLTAAGQEVTVEAADVEIISEDIPGWTIAQEGTITVALDIEITPELKNEGMARLIIKRIQSLRKDSGFEITDRINVVLESKPELEEAVKAFGNHISSQVLANSLTFGDASNGSEQEFGELTAKVLITKN
jgi:isoleucyl-tRNA synthetase